MTAPPRTEPALTLRLVTSEAGFAALRADWNRLVERVGGPVFLRHEWFGAAWAWQRTDAASLWIACAYAGDRLVGVLPLMRPPTSHSGTRLLQFLSVPDAQWCDVLIEPELGSTVARSLVSQLLLHSASWDVLRLDRLALRSQATRWFAPALAEQGLAARVDTVDCNLFVDLKSSWPDYHASLSRSIKKTRNLAANRLARLGTASVQWVTAESVGAHEVGRYVDEVVAISARSWKHVTGNSLDRPGPQAFIRALTETAFAQNWLSVWFLRIDNVAVAMEYQLHCDGHIHAMRADFDDHFKSISPGTYLNFKMLEALFGGSHSRYYMGPGNNPYKSRWSEAGEPVQALISYSPTMRGRAGALWSEVKPRLKTWRDRLTP